MSGARYLELCDRAARLELVVCLGRPADRRARRWRPRLDVGARLVVFVGRRAREEYQPLIVEDLADLGDTPIERAAGAALDVLDGLAEADPEMWGPETWPA